jgi:hypothetical protein
MDDKYVIRLNFSTSYLLTSDYKFYSYFSMMRAVLSGLITQRRIGIAFLRLKGNRHGRLPSRDSPHHRCIVRIGEAFASALAQRGMDLILVARTKPKLDELAQRLMSQHHVQATVIEADLADPKAPERLIPGWPS